MNALQLRRDSAISAPEQNAGALMKWRQQEADAGLKADDSLVPQLSLDNVWRKHNVPAEVCLVQ